VRNSCIKSSVSLKLTSKSLISKRLRSDIKIVKRIFFGCMLVHTLRARTLGLLAHLKRTSSFLKISIRRFSTIQNFSSLHMIRFLRITSFVVFALCNFLLVANANTDIPNHYQEPGCTLIGTTLTSTLMSSSTPFREAFSFNMSILRCRVTAVLTSRYNVHTT
jgi:hypothetical protein